MMKHLPDHHPGCEKKINSMLKMMGCESSLGPQAIYSYNVDRILISVPLL